VDRPLAPRGTRNAETMANRLMERGEVPELILSSPASRALNTALIMSRIWGLDPGALQIHDPLYVAYLTEIEEVVAGVPDHIRKLAIYGHNPSFTKYANQFMEKPLDNLPTAGVVIVTLESDSWKKINRSHVRQVYVDTPKRK